MEYPLLYRRGPAEVSGPISVLKKETVGLCEVCYHQIPARVVTDRQAVYIEKRCPRHGLFRGVMEKNIEFYQRFSTRTKWPSPRFDTLIIPVTFQCNLDCALCYTRQQPRPDPTIPELERIVRRFEGDGVFLSGGEPTIREDLPLMIQSVKRIKPVCGIVTNGLKLADGDYLQSLAAAGLDVVFFSFDSFRESTYRQVKPLKNRSIAILPLKRKALDNLRRAGMMTVLSVTIYPGLNEDEMKDLFRFAIRNHSFIFQIRFRSCVHFEKPSPDREYFTSELLEKFCSQTGIRQSTLLDRCLTPDLHGIHHVMFQVEGVTAGNHFFPVYRDRRRRWTAIDRTLLLLRILLKSGLPDAFRVLKTRLATRVIAVRLIHWPTVHNADLEEIDREVAHLYDEDTIYNFCHTLILYAQNQSGRRAACKPGIGAAGRPEVPVKANDYFITKPARMLSGPAIRMLLTQTLEKGAAFRFEAKGYSMSPFIRNGDRVTVSPSPAGGNHRLGDIVAFIHPKTGNPVLHRIVGINGTLFRLKGDNTASNGDLLHKDQIKGIVTRIERKGKPVSLGLGPERILIAALNRAGVLVPLMLSARRLLRPLIRRPAP